MRCFLTSHDFVASFSVFNKVSFVLGQNPEEAKKRLEGLVLSLTFAEKKMAFIAPIAYRTLYADYYDLLVQGTLEAIRFHRVNKNTLEAFRLHWLINDWRNLKHVSPDVGVFRDAFVGWPAVIVSAGPSLKKNMHLLPAVRERALVIAVVAPLASSTPMASCPISASLLTLRSKIDNCSRTLTPLLARCFTTTISSTKSSPTIRAIRCR
jgi:hypothetical protein